VSTLLQVPVFAVRLQQEGKAASVDWLVLGCHRIGEVAQEVQARLPDGYEITNIEDRGCLYDAVLFVPGEARVAP